jgi:hypothetical protein
VLDLDPPGQLTARVAGVANEISALNRGSVWIDGKAFFLRFLVQDQDPAPNDHARMQEVNDVTQSPGVVRLGNWHVHEADAEPLRARPGRKRDRRYRGSRDENPGRRDQRDHAEHSAQIVLLTSS